MSEPIQISLASSYRFVQSFNVIVFVTLCIYTFIHVPSQLPAANMLFLLLGVIAFGLMLVFGQHAKITHLLIKEGDTHTFLGIVESKIVALDAECLNKEAPNKEAQNDFVMREAHCRHTSIGCWLAFSLDAPATRLTYQNPIRSLISKLCRQEYLWVFVPRFLVEESHYKRICRHLIWYSV